MTKKRNPQRKKLVRQIYKGVRHTHSTTAGIEDTVAVIIDILYNLKRQLTFINQLQCDAKETQERAEKALQTLHILRNGPFAYPLDDDILVIKTVNKNGRRLKISSKGNT